MYQSLVAHPRISIPSLTYAPFPTSPDGPSGCRSWYVCKLASDSPFSFRWFVDGIRGIAPTTGNGGPTEITNEGEKSGRGMGHLIHPVRWFVDDTAFWKYGQRLLILAEARA